MTDQPRRFEDLQVGEAIDLPLPPVSMGRRAAYQRIQRDLFAIYGSGGYQMRAEGCMLRVVRTAKELRPRTKVPDKERAARFR